LGIAAVIAFSWFHSDSLYVANAPEKSGSDNNSPAVLISGVNAEMPDYGGMDIVGCIKNLTTGPLDSVQ
jgi:hypothetical protein